MNITSNFLREKFLEFFKNKGHSIISSASLIPENDPTVLFTTAGMHPLVPYLLGEKHPAGNRLCNVQKCVRTGDIDEVGDISHCTFFEMLGNWSLGDYFKKEAITWSFEFLTSEKYLNIPIEKISVSVFEGDENAPRDDESAQIWQSLGIKKENIYYLAKEHNWWGPAGTTGPCGPDTEMFIDLGGGCGKANCSPACDCKRFIEIWNDVFMQYFKDENGKYLPMQNKNVDTGMGLERTLVVLNNKNSVYETDLFEDALAVIENLTGKKYGESDEVTKSFRILLDHIRTATFMIGDERGITPSNVDQGYVLRRIIRRAVRYGKKVELPENSLKIVAAAFVKKYEKIYPELKQNSQKIFSELELEEERFSKTLINGVKEFDKLVQALDTQSRQIADFIGFLRENSAFIDQNNIKLSYPLLKQNAPFKDKQQAFNVLKSANLVNEIDLTNFDDQFKSVKEIDGKSAFRLYDTYGFPVEITSEMAAEKGLSVDIKGFENAYLEHQEKSKSGSEQRFKGGLADSKEQTARLHTATHLLQAALRKVCSEQIEQKGSNITSDRLRFDFNFERPLTEDEIKKVEDFVNSAIKADIKITVDEMHAKDAKKCGAIGVFESRYGEKVKVYTIDGISKEICGGPHAKSTAELGSFKITKEQSSSAGVRRIRAVLE